MHKDKTNQATFINAIIIVTAFANWGQLYCKYVYNIINCIWPLR